MSTTEKLPFTFTARVVIETEVDVNANPNLPEMRERIWEQCGNEDGILTLDQPLGFQDLAAMDSTTGEKIEFRPVLARIIFE